MKVLAKITAKELSDVTIECINKHIGIKNIDGSISIVDLRREHACVEFESDGQKFQSVVYAV